MVDNTKADSENLTWEQQKVRLLQQRVKHLEEEKEKERTVELEKPKEGEFFVYFILIKLYYKVSIAKDREDL